MNLTFKLAGAMVMLALHTAIMLGSSVVHAQTGAAPQTYGNRLLSMALLKPHLDDVRQMVIDLSSVNSPEMAKYYEAAMAQRIGNIVQNQQRVKDAIPSADTAKREGNMQPDMRQALQTLAQMNEQLFPKIALQMERVEKLNPNLKRYFDTVRTFKY
ncbi:MAG: hypothetical protein LW629_08535 [Burkholderiales bacterium]|jgi:glycyl-tRNA synthetase beta subunit|nr:hypothetical protein [Burkholderiales bacterium]